MWRSASLEHRMSRVESVCILYREVSKVCKWGSTNSWSGIGYDGKLWPATAPVLVFAPQLGTTSTTGTTQGFRFWAPWHTPRSHQGSGCLGKSCPAYEILCFAKWLPSLESVPGACFTVWVNREQRGAEEWTFKIQPDRYGTTRCLC